jgi:hypothetical protein
MHKKGITEEVAKKRSRKTVKHQRGIVGADIAAIAAKRNQTAAVRQQQRLTAIAKAKTERKDKESKKDKVTKVCLIVHFMNPRLLNDAFPSGSSTKCCCRSEGVEAADEGWSKGCRKTVLVRRTASHPMYITMLIAQYHYATSISALILGYIPSTIQMFR